jgi:hypothetical protein
MRSVAVPGGVLVHCPMVRAMRIEDVIKGYISLATVVSNVKSDAGGHRGMSGLVPFL